MELSHKIEVEPNIFIRAYLWLYEADKNNINTCKLAWGLIFFLPVALFVNLFLKPLFFIGDFIGSHLPERERKPARTYVLAEPKESRESKLDRWATKFSMWWSTWGPRIGIAILALIGAAILTGVVIGVIALLATPLSEILTAIAVILAWVVGMAVAALLIVGLFTLLDTNKARAKRKGLKNFFRILGTSFHDHTCARITVKENNNAETV